LGFRRSQQNQFTNLWFPFYYPEEFLEVEAPMPATINGKGHAIQPGERLIDPTNRSGV
jgi:hypothetical protein